MKVGISLACFYPEHPEEVVSKVSGLGFDLFELFVNTYSELDVSFIKKISKLCEKYDSHIYSLHPFTSALENYMFFSPYDRRIEDSKKLYEKYFEAADYLGAKVINIHGDRGIGLNNFDLYVECLKPLMELSEKYDIIASHENVFFNSVNHPEFIIKLKSALGEKINFTFDIKQANKGGSDPYKVCDAMSGNIVNFHINDFDQDHICMLPGEGTVDYKRVFDTLENSGYRGPAIIEVYSDNYSDINQLKKSKGFLENIKNS